MTTLAEALRAEEEALRRRFIWHTRPKGPLSLADVIAFAERLDPLPRCEHGNALRDGAGETLEPSCGCRHE